MKTTTKFLTLLAASINLIFSIGIIRAQTSANQDITPCTKISCFAIDAPASLPVNRPTFISNAGTNLAIGFNTDLGQELRVVDYRLDGGFGVSVSASPFYLSNDNNGHSYTVDASPVKINFDQIKILSYNSEIGDSIDGNLPLYNKATSLIQPQPPVTSGSFTYQDYLDSPLRTDPTLYPATFGPLGGTSSSSDLLPLINADVPSNDATCLIKCGRYGNYRLGLGFLIQLPDKAIDSPGLVDGRYNLDITFYLYPTTI